MVGFHVEGCRFVGWVGQVMFQSQPFAGNIIGKYQAEVRHLSHA